MPERPPGFVEQDRRLRLARAAVRVPGRCGRGPAVPLTREPILGMLAYMKRTTIKLDDALDARMRHEAMRRGLTVSEWTREAIAEHLPNGGQEGRVRRRFRSAGSGDSGRTDIAERMEEILAGLAEGDDILDDSGDEGYGRRLSA